MNIFISNCAGLCFGLLLLVDSSRGAEPQSASTQPTTQNAEPAKAEQPVVFATPPDGVYDVTFVCDASGSFLQKFSTLRREIAKTIQAMPVSESFGLIFMQEKGYVAFDMQLVAATARSKLAATNFLEDKVVPKGETNPIPAIELAFKQIPQMIYLLTDGDFPDNKAVLQKIRELNKAHSARINTILFANEADTDLDIRKVLNEIAEENGGTFKYVKESDL